MALEFGETTGLILRWLRGTNKVSDIDEGFKALAEDCAQKLMGYSQDTKAKRPAAGVANRIFKITTGTEAGMLSYDSGTAWEPLVGPGIGAPSSQVERTSGTEYEANASRPVLVTLEATASGANVELTVIVGGVTIGHWGGGPAIARAGVGAVVGCLFLVPPGEKWSATRTSTTGGELRSSYLPI